GESQPLPGPRAVAGAELLPVDPPPEEVDPRRVSPEPDDSLLDVSADGEDGVRARQRPGDGPAAAGVPGEDQYVGPADDDADRNAGETGRPAGYRPVRVRPITQHAIRPE